MAAQVETLTNVLHQEAKAATQTDSVSPPRDGTLMCHLVPSEAAKNPQPPSGTLPHLDLDPQSHPHPAAAVMTLATDLASAVAAPQADQYLPSVETAEEREGPARTTVTVLDLDPPIPAVPRAHVLPEENAAVCPHLHVTADTRDALRAHTHPLAPVLPLAPVAPLTVIAETVTLVV